jgi:hypothetical protein
MPEVRPDHVASPVGLLKRQRGKGGGADGKARDPL